MLMKKYTGILEERIQPTETEFGYRGDLSYIVNNELCYLGDATH
jgi:hypothetical protein